MTKILTENNVNAAVWAKYLELCEIHKLQDSKATHLKLIDVEGYPCAAKFTLNGKLILEELIQPINDDGALYPQQMAEIKTVFKR